jgi:hypothetical protein
MKELCRRDDEANRDKDVNINTNHNDFKIADIYQDVLPAWDLERVIDSLQRFAMDNNDPFIEFVDQNRRERVRLTDAGRAHCGESGL